jgi:hypothetical protein
MVLGEALGITGSSPIKFVAAEAGFLPPGPCTDFADILNVCPNYSTSALDVAKLHIRRCGLRSL